MRNKPCRYNAYQAHWSYDDGKRGPTTDPLKDWCIGSVLNLCCGKSKLGDLTIDISSIENESIIPDVIADVHYLPIRRFSFDTVILDPPYSYFCKFKWLFRIGDISKKRLIISAGQFNVLIPSFALVDILAVVVTNRFYVKLWYVFDRYQNPLQSD